MRGRRARERRRHRFEATRNHDTETERQTISEWPVYASR